VTRDRIAGGLLTVVLMATLTIATVRVARGWDELRPRVSGDPAPAFTLRAIDADGGIGGSVSLESFRGKVVLLDFWATWCGPCIRAIPKMIELDSALPEDEFEILSISVDEEVETVTEFHKIKPMPWTHWHVGPRADLLQTWAVRGYPTYILVDQDGAIVARQHDLNKDFMALIMDTACGPTGGSC